ncbi:TusE/DsrC/DsvC family sulfur relay protein [Blochmannia endosymbiont of Camponotus sp. C-003]|uniref:TusE/DsrC/DsvC family sulfur relay protein n=1 Tax=unclassified Candidatus Blochmanniella TaxID=711328 RepID=UPI00202598F8|nr:MULTISPECIES: TusE/DsrC/DsvC family sulfur relay protein [unclassified Candidatus Blochmannia]URJ23406.1 TusE/DsrC/DsvC family sulfur relay protein [Blochmannia endosymbiont of Camponotus sp. C-003]URJ28879.1 TusE/DsrC/DsvC family sulfur relay protein [Blochmannia endosymbiont of Camponotus sp. C-046]
MKCNQINDNIDSQGYLIHLEDWNEEIAIKIATLEGIALSPIHWDIIYFARKFYMEFNSLPKTRILINAIALKYGKEKGNSQYLARLFPKGSAAQKIAKISGLPKPIKCL